MRLNRRGLRSDALRDSYNFVAGGIHRTPDSGSDSREDCRAIGRAFLSFEDLDFVAVRVGLDLAPQGRARSAATQANVSYRHPHLARTA